jgi:hypothetical protein
VRHEWRQLFADEMEEHLATLAAPRMQAAILAIEARQLAALLEPLTAADRRELCEYAAMMAAKRVAERAS